MSLRCWQAPGPRGWGRLQSPEKPRRLITDWKQGRSGCSGDFFSFPIPGSEGDKSMLPTLLQSKVAAFLKSKLNIHPWERNPFTPACLVQLPYKMQLRKLQATYSKKKKKSDLPKARFVMGMNGNVDIFRKKNWMGWGTSSVFWQDCSFKTNPIFSSEKLCFSSEYYICGVFIAVQG